MGSLLRRGFKSWTEATARGLRAELGLRPDERLPALLLAEHMGIHVVLADRVQMLTGSVRTQLFGSGRSNWSAISFFKDGETMILLNPHSSEARQESNILHECSHILCGHQPERLAALGDCIVRDYDSMKEQEANWLAGSLLLPRPALERAVQLRMTVLDVQHQFRASDQMVAYRCNVTGACQIAGLDSPLTGR